MAHGPRRVSNRRVGRGRHSPSRAKDQPFKIHKNGIIDIEDFKNLKPYDKLFYEGRPVMVRNPPQNYYGMGTFGSPLFDAVDYMVEVLDSDTSRGSGGVYLISASNIDKIRRRKD